MYVLNVGVQGSKASLSQNAFHDKSKNKKECHMYVPIAEVLSFAVDIGSVKYAKMTVKKPTFV